MAKNQKKKKKQVVELTPAEKFVRFQTLKKATRCMYVEQDVYDVYKYLVKSFAELDEIGKETPFEGCEQCAALSQECEVLAEEWKKNHATERVEESRTVTTSAKERETREKGRKKSASKWVAIAALVLIIGFTICYQVDATRYQIARIGEAAGFTQWAKSSYVSLGDYKDSKARMMQIQKKIIRDTKKGHIVKFGATPVINAKGETVRTDCSWIVVDKQEDAVLLTKQSAINDIPYHNTDEPVTWEQCTLRQELNNTFLEQTFSPLERSIIMDTQVICNNNETYRTGGGGATTDKIFIMNENEVRQYRKQLRAKLKTMRLRTPGKEKDTTTYVSALGQTGDKEKEVDIIDYGFPVERNGACIRPTMWVNCK